MSSLLPRSLLAWHERRRALREIERLHQQEERAVYQNFANSNGYVGVARALMEMQRLGEAEERLTLAIHRFPVVPEIAIARAHFAYRRGDKEETVRRWADDRRRFPKLPVGYQDEIRLLRELGCGEDVDAVALGGSRPLP